MSRLAFVCSKFLRRSLAVGIGVLFLATAARAASPAARTHKLIETFKTIKTPPEGAKLSSVDEAANAKAFGVLVETRVAKNRVSAW